MIFRYEAISNTGEKKTGTVEAPSSDLAIAAIQRRGLIVSNVKEESGGNSFLKLSFFEKKVKMKDIVIMSRQISTLFNAQVSALKAFNLLSTNTENETLVKILNSVSEDIQAGVSISQAMSKYPKVFSDFYVNMVKSGEESGKLSQTFAYLADYLERQYQLTSKTKNALIYPGFVIGVFFVVMVLMFTFIVPKLTAIIKESGQDIPLSTKVIIAISNLFVNYGLYLLIAVIIFVIYVVRLMRTKNGQEAIDKIKINMPVFKDIYRKLYYSRIADNLETMLTSGVSIIHSLEITSSVVGNRIFENILDNVTTDVKAGSSLSDAFSKYPEIPPIMSGMIRVGEETGSLSNILKTLGVFYGREVNEAVDTLVSLIEPLMIVFLGLGVGVLLTSVLMPIYNVTSGMG